MSNQSSAGQKAVREAAAAVNIARGAAAGGVYGAAVEWGVPAISGKTPSPPEEVCGLGEAVCLPAVPEEDALPP